MSSRLGILRTCRVTALRLGQLEPVLLRAQPCGEPRDQRGDVLCAEAALPHDRDAPADTGEERRIARIAGDIARELYLPELRPARRGRVDALGERGAQDR